MKTEEQFFHIMFTALVVIMRFTEGTPVRDTNDDERLGRPSPLLSHHIDYTIRVIGSAVNLLEPYALDDECEDYSDFNFDDAGKISRKLLDYMAILQATLTAFDQYSLTDRYQEDTSLVLTYDTAQRFRRDIIFFKDRVSSFWRDINRGSVATPPVATLPEVDRLFDLFGDSYCRIKELRNFLQSWIQ